MLAGVLVYLLAGRNWRRNIVRTLVLALLVAPVLAFTPLGEVLYSSATAESQNFDYRVRVFEVATGVILQSPFFGAFNALYSPAMQELRQGQGIIDIVNTYIGVGLRSGLVGMSLFAGFFVAVALRLWPILRSASLADTGAGDVGRALLAALACIVVTIGTVSPITYVPIIYYLVSALCVAFARVHRDIGAPASRVRVAPGAAPRREIMGAPRRPERTAAA